MCYSNLEKETTKKIDILMLFGLELSQEKRNQIRNDLELQDSEDFFKMSLHKWQDKGCCHVHLKVRYDPIQQ